MINCRKTVFAVLGMGLALFAGCTGVPTTRITLPMPGGQSIIIDGPKNTDIHGFEASVGSNGILSVRFDRWNSTNDPSVIDRAGAAQAAMINAWAAIVGPAIQSAAKAAPLMLMVTPSGHVQMVPIAPIPQTTNPP